MRATAWDGRKCATGKPNPVRLVARVLARKIAVQPSSRFAVSNPNTTTNPAPIPTRLMTTWTTVNVVRKLTIHVLSELTTGPSRLQEREEIRVDLGCAESAEYDTSRGNSPPAGVIMDGMSRKRGRTPFPPLGLLAWAMCLGAAC